MQSQRRIVSGRDNLVSRTPVSQLLPALAGNQSIIVVSLTPDIMALDVWLVALCIGTPLPNSRRDCLGAQLSEVLFDRFERLSREIP